MQSLTRRQFLQFSALAGVGLSISACQPIRRPEELSQSSAATVADRRSAAVAQAVQTALETHKIPGLAVAIVQDNELVYANGFGVRNLETGKPMTATSVMSMASISKAFTATAIMQLAEAGKVDVDEPYVTYVPYFEMEDARYKAITIRHLLAHRSGMPELTPDLFFSEWDDPWVDDEAAERYVRSFKTGVTLNQEPGGDQFTYSDFGYDILADLIHKVSGELFEDYIKHHIFEPLGMANSTFLLNEVDAEQLVAAHVYDDAGNAVVWENFPYDRKHAPSSCLHSTVEDLSRWVLAHLNGGERNGKRILQTASQAQLWEMLFEWGGEDLIRGYGWGCWLGEFEGKPLVASFGAQPGVQTIAALLPTEGLAVIVLGNLYGSLGAFEDPYYISEVSSSLLGKLLRGEI